MEPAQQPQKAPVVEADAGAALTRHEPLPTRARAVQILESGIRIGGKVVTSIILRADRQSPIVGASQLLAEDLEVHLLGILVRAKDHRGEIEERVVPHENIAWWTPWRAEREAP